MTSLEDARKMLKKSQKAHKLPWYTPFLMYIEEEYYAPPPNECIPLLLYHLRDEEWYHYSERLGVYVPLHKKDMLDIFYHWAENEEPEFITSTRSENHGLNRLAVKVRSREVWDSGIYNKIQPVDNISNGILDLTTKKLYPHTPTYFSKRQIPRHYIPNTPMPPELKRLYSATPDHVNIHKWLVGAVHQRFDMELILFLYGPRGAGKTPLLLMIEYLFGSASVSKTPLHKLGTQFGLKESYDKRFNIYADLASKPITTDTVSVIKVIVGDIGGEIEVEKKGKDSFKHPILCFHIYATNQCMKFGKNVTEEIESIMKRLCLGHYPTPQLRDDAFKASLKDPDLLDRIYSYLIDCEYEPLITENNSDEWIRANKERWFLDAEPVNRIVHELYEYDNSEIGYNTKKDLPDYHTILCHDVENEVRVLLEDEGRTASGSLMAEITEALKTMRIIRNGRGAKGHYQWIKRIEPEAKKNEETEEKKKEEKEIPKPKEANDIFTGFSTPSLFDPALYVDRLLAWLKPTNWATWELEDLQSLVSEWSITSKQVKLVVKEGIKRGWIKMNGSVYEVRS